MGERSVGTKDTLTRAGSRGTDRGTDPVAANTRPQLWWWGGTIINHREQEKEGTYDRTLRLRRKGPF